MKTAKAVATISYNTTDYLNKILDNLVLDHVIDFYAYIVHKPESDNLKQHIHLYLEPILNIDTIEFAKEFNELDLTKPDKPLTCKPFQKSKKQDWLLYSLHDIGYLYKKGMRRKFHYDIKDFVTSDKDRLQQEYEDAIYNNSSKVYRAIVDGLTAFEALNYGFISVNQFNNYNLVLDNYHNNNKDLQAGYEDSGLKIIDNDNDCFF